MEKHEHKAMKRCEILNKPFNQPFNLQTTLIISIHLDVYRCLEREKGTGIILYVFPDSSGVKLKPKKQLKKKLRKHTLVSYLSGRMVSRAANNEGSKQVTPGRSILIMCTELRRILARTCLLSPSSP